MEEIEMISGTVLLARAVFLWVAASLVVFFLTETEDELITLITTVVILLVMSVVIVASITLGMWAEIGRMNPTSHPLSAYLSTGKIYTLMDAYPDGKGNIVVVKDETSASDKHSFFIIRTREVRPPKHFAIINGKPRSLPSP